MLSVEPRPWSLISVLSVTTWALAVVAAWKSAYRVVPQNRVWTRAWRILVAFLGFSINGVWLAIGAAYILVKYRGALRWTRRRSLVA